MRGKFANVNVCCSMKDVFPDVASQARDSFKQGGLQAISLVVTLGMALGGGLIVGEYGAHMLLITLDQYSAWRTFEVKFNRWAFYSDVWLYILFQCVLALLFKMGSLLHRCLYTGVLFGM